MADDDDTSAGLTPAERKRPMRRRASRTAGPASGNGSRPVEEARVVDSGATTTGTITLEKNRTPNVEVDEVATETETVVLPLSAGETAPEEWHPIAPAVPRRSRGLLAAAIAVGLVVVALLGVGGWLLFERSAASNRDAQRQAFQDTAQQTVLNLTTIKPDTAKEDVERILAGASGEFKAEFDGRQDPFVSIVKEAGVTTVGRIVATGMESENGNTAKVLVSARADVTSANGEQNGPRDFRMRVTVTDDNGTLTASKVEFVP